MTRTLPALAIGVLMTLPHNVPVSRVASAQDPGLTVRLGGVEWRTGVAFAPVLPRESLDIEVRDPLLRRWTLAAPAGELTHRSPRAWRWRAPGQHGIVTAHLVGAGATDPSVELKLLVMVPASRATDDGRLNGYRIGAYPARPLGGNPIYLPPDGFVEVTDENEDERLSPRFELGQFTSKQSEAFPRYVVIDPALIVTLERLAERLDALDLPSRLHVMSGYRTPFYNHAIGNVRYSLHQWGSAADVFVDEDENGRMDDLNGDGLIDRRDAIALFGVVDTLGPPSRGGSRFAGGLGIYGATRAHGPFLHIDVRGRAARW